MRLFSSRKNKEPQRPVTLDDQEWIEENLEWLYQSCGYPLVEQEQAIFNANFFPLTHSGELKPDNLLKDLCAWLHLVADDVSLEFREDIRDIDGMPYDFEGAPFESASIMAGNKYQVLLAKNLLKHPGRMLRSLAYELVKIRLHDDKLEYEAGEDSDHFVFLAAIYLGLGVIIFDSVIEKGRYTDGFWQTEWNFQSIVPPQVVAFALAVQMQVTNNMDPNWMKELKPEFQRLLEQALSYLQQHPSRLLNKKEQEAQEKYKEAFDFLETNEFERMIDVFRQALFLTQDSLLLSDIHNNIGYYQQRLGDFEKSLASLQKSLEYDDSNAYAFSNCGYALVMLGRLDDAAHIMKEILEVNDQKGYAHRNLAVYHWKKGENELAEKHFRKGLEQKEPTDLLEFHYSQFLLQLGRREEALKFLEISLDRGEPEALLLKAEIERA